MNVGVAYAARFRQIWLRLDVPAASRVQDAIERSGLLGLFPEIDLERQAVGIFGRIVTLNAPLSEGDRVEIYRPITADPETVQRRDIEEGD
jgi:uncharacterized protein